MSELTEFLLARIAEDEAEAGDAERAELVLRYANVDWAARVLRECEAKRRIVEGIKEATMDGRDSRAIGPFLSTDDILAEMAAVYADHADYRDEWKP